jgi:hypothetical protein
MVPLPFCHQRNLRHEAECLHEAGEGKGTADRPAIGAQGPAGKPLQRGVAFFGGELLHGGNAFRLLVEAATLP